MLGLPPGAGPEEIRSAWRDLSQVWHPDRFGHSDRLRARAERNLQRINEAHETLLNAAPGGRESVAARLTESFAAILGIGDLGAPPQPARAPAPGAPAGPIGARHSVRVLGVGAPVYPPLQPRGWRRRKRRMTIAAAVLAVGAAVYLILR